jgi:hypothetical protein
MLQRVSGLGLWYGPAVNLGASEAYATRQSARLAGEHDSTSDDDLTYRPDGIPIHDPAPIPRTSV